MAGILKKLILSLFKKMGYSIVSLRKKKCVTVGAHAEEVLNKSPSVISAKVEIQACAVKLDSRFQENDEQPFFQSFRSNPGNNSAPFVWHEDLILTDSNLQEALGFYESLCCDEEVVAGVLARAGSSYWTTIFGCRIRTGSRAARLHEWLPFCSRRP